jgi:hypothetical protein
LVYVVFSILFLVNTPRNFLSYDVMRIKFWSFSSNFSPVIWALFWNIIFKFYFSKYANHIDNIGIKIPFWFLKKIRLYEVRSKAPYIFRTFYWKILKWQKVYHRKKIEKVQICQIAPTPLTHILRSYEQWRTLATWL